MEQSPPKTTFWKWLDDHLEETILIVLLLVLTALTGLQVMMRKVFSSPLSWTEELCRYCFMWSGFFGIAYCIRKRCEIRITTFLNLFKGPAYGVLLALGDIICIVMYAVFFYTSAVIINKAIASQQISPAIGIPNYLIYTGALVSFGLALIRQVQNLAEDVRLIRHPAEPAATAK